MTEEKCLYCGEWFWAGVQTLFYVCEGCLSAGR